MTSKLIVGLDIGTLTAKTILSLLQPDNEVKYELVRTSQGDHALPAAVSFQGDLRPRLIGEDSSFGRGDENTVEMLDRLLGAGDDDDPFRPFHRFRHDRTDDTVRIEGRDLSTTALLAVLLGRVKANVVSTALRIGGVDEDSNDVEHRLQFVFAVPPSYPLSIRGALMDAASAVGVVDSVVLDSTVALGRVLYERKFKDACDGKVVLVVEMGHARTNISLLRFGSAGDAVATEGTDENELVSIVANVSSPNLGAGIIDICLYRHFISKHPSLAGATFATNSRSGQRLMEGCSKLKHLLSLLTDGSVTVERIGKNESDVKLSASRDLLQKLCEDSVTTVFKQLIHECIEKSGMVNVQDNIAVVELTGGGCRIPFIQDVIRNSLKKGEDFTFSKSLDDTSLALGAAMMVVKSPSLSHGTIGLSSNDVTIDTDRKDRREGLLRDEKEMARNDAELLQKDVIRNQIEAHILELRSARHSSNHSSLLPTSEEFINHLDGTDDWLFSQEFDNATLKDMAKKWEAVRCKTEELCADYLQAKRLEFERKDQEMQEEAARAAAERDVEMAMNGDDGNEVEDHDTRRLPAKRRMEIVMKNKAEANELFGDGNYKFAAARYGKALSHCTKFFDLSPDEEQELKEVKLSLHINMALAYSKLDKNDNAFQSCNEALAIDPTNVKALFRRATVQHGRRKFDDALKDLKEAEQLAPEDKAVKKLMKSVDNEITKQKSKEKEMAQKMFG